MDHGGINYSLVNDCLRVEWRINDGYFLNHRHRTTIATKINKKQKWINHIHNYPCELYIVVLLNFMPKQLNTYSCCLGGRMLILNAHEMHPVGCMFGRSTIDSLTVLYFQRCFRDNSNRSYSKILKNNRIFNSKLIIAVEISSNMWHYVAIIITECVSLSNHDTLHCRCVP